MSHLGVQTDIQPFRHFSEQPTITGSHHHVFASELWVSLVLIPVLRGHVCEITAACVLQVTDVELQQSLLLLQIQRSSSDTTGPLIPDSTDPGHRLYARRQNDLSGC